MPKPYATRLNLRGRTSGAVAALTTEIATTRDGMDITRPFVSGLQEPRDPRLRGSVDWGVYDRILQDDQVFSTLQQRRTAVVSCDWTCVAGDQDDPRSVAAADAFSVTLKRIGWDRVTDKMLFAVFHGIAIAEIMWEQRAGLIDFASIHVRHARRFRFDDAGELKLITRAAPQGKPLEPRKFWTFIAGGSDDDELYGRGLAEWLYWPVLFKKNGLRFWNTFLDKFGSPTALGKYRPGTPRADIDKLLGALGAIATDSGIAVPEGMAIELLQVARSGTADFAALCRYMDEAIAKVILSQTMTTQDGASLSQAQVHAGVKEEVVRSDADLLSDSFAGQDGPVRWWTDINFGTDVAAPIVRRVVGEEIDAKVEAETDGAIKGLGWELTEEAFRDKYGEGYAKVAPATLPSPDAAVQRRDQADEEGAYPGDANDTTDPKSPASFAADDPRPLYVYRRLLNADELIAWAQAQGFRTTLPAADLHVTQAYSKRPVNWMQCGAYWGWPDEKTGLNVGAGGPRLIERFGDSAVVLVFYAGALENRWRDLRDKGCSWDFESYFPHVTITYDAGDVDLAQVTPFKGELRFGPEIFEPLEEDWQAQVREASFAAPAGPAPSSSSEAVTVDDPDDALADQLVAEAGYRAAKALTDPILGAVRAADSEAELRALLNAAPGDPAAMTQVIENASVATRLEEEN
ncbi:MAG: DUF935 family protein [Thermomonas sp.]|uniref:phage portal protein family protein n=1 Tax=Thermomonas sp. TaxID=1971895 RepID=UPI00261A43D4|nr:DUF935 family protein [Thermomonas sp.]MCC7097252.1 DUF935 family protein [Thermomonas sp.]